MATTNIFDLNMNQQPLSDSYYVFLVNQGDYYSRTIQANLYITYTKDGNRTDYNLTTETVVIVYEYTDSNGELQTTDEFECTKETSIGNNVISFLIPNIVLANYGKVRAQVKVYEDESTLINSVAFLFYVTNSVDVGTYGDDTIPLFLTVLVDSGDPTTATVGSETQFYINSDNDSLWYCSDVTGIVYTWNEVVSSEDYVTKVLFDAHTVLYATTNNTPITLSVTEQTLVGRLTGGNIDAISMGIADNNVVQMDDADAASGDYAKFTANGLEGRSYTEVKQDLDLEIGTDVLAQQTIGIANDNLVEMDDADAASGDYAKFTANGLEGKSTTEVLSDIGASNILTAIKTVDGSGSGLDADKLDSYEATNFGRIAYKNEIAASTTTDVVIDSGTYLLVIASYASTRIGMSIVRTAGGGVNIVDVVVASEIAVSTPANATVRFTNSSAIVSTYYFMRLGTI